MLTTPQLEGQEQHYHWANPHSSFAATSFFFLPSVLWEPPFLSISARFLSLKPSPSSSPLRPWSASDRAGSPIGEAGCWFSVSDLLTGVWIWNHSEVSCPLLPRPFRRIGAGAWTTRLSWRSSSPVVFLVKLQSKVFDWDFCLSECFLSIWICLSSPPANPWSVLQVWT